MKSIAVTKPDMGVLSRDRLILSPFGALSQAFGEELLARAEQSEGAWSYVPLDLLEEKEAPAPPAAPVKPVLQVNLQLVLEALRREGSRTEQQRATERIVERILQLQTRNVPPGKQAGPAHSPSPSLSVFGTIRQEFHPQLIQNIRISAPASQPKAMGELARKARDFSHRLQALREEGASPAREVRLAQGTIQPVSPAQVPPTGPASGGTASLSPLPQQALTLLEEQEGQTAPFQEQNTRLLRQMDQLQTLLETVEQKDTKSGSSPARPGQAADHSPRSPSLSAGGRETETHPRKGAPDPTSRPQEVTHGHSPAAHAQSSPLPAAGKQAASSPSPRELSQAAPVPSPRLSRDIRVNGDSPQGTISPLEPAAQALGQTAGSLAPRSVSGAAAPILPGLGQPPVELTLPTGERGETEQDFSHASPAKEHPGRNRGKTIPKTAVSVEKREQGSAQSDATGERPSSVFHTAPQAAPGLVRDIRFHPDTPLVPISAGKNTSQAMGQAAGAPLVPQQVSGGTAPISRQPGQLPVELTLPTEDRRETGLAFPTSSQHSPTAARDIRVNPDVALGTTSPGDNPFQVTGQTTGVFPDPGQVSGDTTPILPKAGQLPVKLTLPTEDRREAGLSFPKASGLVEKSELGTIKSTAPTETIPFSFPMSSQHSPTAARDIRVNPGVVLGTTFPGENVSQAMGQTTGVFLDPGQVSGSASPTLPGPGQLPVDLTLPTEEPEKSGQVVSQASSLTKDPGQDVRQMFPKSAVPVEKPGQGTANSAVSGGSLSSVFHRASQPAPGLARDIRVNRGDAAPEAGDTPLRTPPPIQYLTDRPTGEDASGVSAGPAQVASHLSGTASPGVSPITQPLSLTYGPVPGNPSSPPSEPQPDGEPSPAEESDFVRSLPDWARRFLKQSRTPSAASHAMGVARDISTIPPAQEPETTQWVAPNYQPPQAVITHREKKQEERPRQAQEVQISEAEIQRTADRVYRIIEDRIRRERRRLGL